MKSLWFISYSLQNPYKFRCNFVSYTFPIMNTLTFLKVAVPSDPVVANGSLSYLTGGIVALLILGYLVYILLHPEKL